MWDFNTDKNKWINTQDKLKKSDFNFIKEELKSTRFYSKCLSGATYLPVNNIDNIYDILNEYEPRTWYINGSEYNQSIIPSTISNLKPIDSETSYEYYNKYISEYGLTLKNLFTPDRLIKDSIKNFLYVDVATTEQIDINLVYDTLIIDSVRVKNDHRVLIKNQLNTETLPIDVDPNTYFNGNFRVVQDFGATIEYEYFNNENGIYLFKDKRLTRTDDLTEYDDCIRYSVLVKLGNTNTQKQFHLSRLLNGYYPTSSLSEPMEFIEKHNWLIRNRVDYNNLFEINYYDVIKNPTQSYSIESITYSIPERTISVGEFGVILNVQYNISNIIPNKYKVNLRSISETETHYWVCGDEATLLKVRKHDFNIDKVKIDSIYNLKSISFFNNLKGVVVGEFNTIFITNDGGIKWDKIIVDDFNAFIYNKVLFYQQNKIFIIGNTGVFLELEEDLNGWSVYKRRVSRFIDDYEEHILVDNINDMLITKFDSNVNWGLSFSAYTQSTNINKEILLLVTDDSKFIALDLNESIPNFDFLFLDFDKNYGNVRNIIRSGASSSLFYFTTENNGINLFDILMFQYIGESDNIYSNTVKCHDFAITSSDYFVNKLFSYNDSELIICGNESLLLSSDYSSLDFQEIDNTLDERLKSKLLFLDYDAASKLNFFTDSGEYRLPNNVIFDTTNDLDDITYLSGPLNDALYSQSNSSVLNYYLSSIDVTNAPDSPKQISVRVNLKQNVNSLTLNLISPTGKIINMKRSGNGSGNILTNTVFTSDLSKPNINFSTSPYTDEFSMDSLLNRGFSPYVSNVTTIVELFNGDSVEGEWSIYASWGSRRIIDILEDVDLFRTTPPDFDPLAIATQTGTFSNWDITFEYGSTNEIDFEQVDFSKLWFEPIIHGATAPSYVTQSELSWMDYWKDVSKTFEYYTSFDDANSVIISTTFSCRDNNKFGIGISDRTNNISDFKQIAPSLSIDSNSDIIAGPTAITSPLNTKKLYVYKNMLIVRTPTNFDVSKGDIIRIELDSIDTIFVVNRILNISGGKLIYMFTTFNDTMIKSIIDYSGLVYITNINSYLDKNELELNFNIHPISNGYVLNLDGDKTITISPKFNNITSYYNLATNVIAVDSLVTVEKSMIYTDGFLKFGYTPTYNILDYLEGLNDSNTNLPKFYADKEYFCMPKYIEIPMSGNLSFTSTQLYIDYNGIQYNTGYGNSNKLYFGVDRKYEWESIFINTFVDVVVHANDGDHTTERLLIMKKYLDTSKTIQDVDLYVIEFHKSINYTIGVFQHHIDIISRRSLLQISNDLQELNNIQRGRFKEKVLGLGMSFNNLERDINFKVSTDSYAKILLSDVDTIAELSAIIYTDAKNEFSMNVTKLDREYSIPIANTSYFDDGFGAKILISCQTKHGLKTKDGVVLEFNGGENSSELLNQNYFGYHNVFVVDSFNFYLDIPFGNLTIGNDVGFVKFIKRDPFLNYQPIDLIDVGVDKRVKNSILLDIENVKLEADVFSLTNVDYNRFRFRLVDGLTIEELILKYSWILEAEIEDAIIGQNSDGIVWYKGIWECGRWFGGTWISGTWKNGDWYGGTWNSKRIIDNLISIEIDSKSIDVSQSTWVNGRWFDGTWNNGRWYNGRWYAGTWNDGDWYKGIWNDGTWNDGVFSGGVWVDGTWNGGIFNCDNDPSFWIQGKWKGGDFENGIWYNGIFEQSIGESRFGTKAYNSRTANWYGGQWLSGSFYSKENGADVSKSHIYSIWRTGSWYNGDWYGGIAYNIDFKSGTWHGGILEDIQVIGIEADYILLNGIFRFNTGDEVTILGSESTEYQSIGSHDEAKVYKVIKADVDMSNQRTKLYIDIEDNILSTSSLLSRAILETDTKLRVVSRFRNSNWKSGIWSNGYYESGLWEGGIWYDGLFKAKWM